MKVDTKALSYILHTLDKRHRNVEVVRDVEGEAVRYGASPGWRFRIRTVWYQEVHLDERDMLLAPDMRGVLALVEDRFAQGASELRGSIFRDLLFNDREHPVDYLGSGSPDEVAQRIEALGITLIERADRIGK